MSRYNHGMIDDYVSYSSLRLTRTKLRLVTSKDAGLKNGGMSTLRVGSGGNLLLI